MNFIRTIPTALVATGFNRHFPDESNARNLMQRRQEILNDITDTVGADVPRHDLRLRPLPRSQVRSHPAEGLLPAAGVLRQHPHRRRGIAGVSDPSAPSTGSEYAVWEAKTKDIRGEMAKLAEPALKAMYKDNFDKFPAEIQDAITTAPEKRTPYPVADVL